MTALPRSIAQPRASDAQGLHLDRDLPVPERNASRLPSHDGDREPPEIPLPALEPAASVQKVCVWSVNEQSVQDVLVNPKMFPAGALAEAALMRMAPVTSYVTETAGHEVPVPDNGSALLFFAKFISDDALAARPDLQVSIPQQAAAALRFPRGGPVLLSTAEEGSCRATHVEMVFRDQYLSRADMWRLVGDQLAGRCVHRGQSIEFMGTIRVVVKTIFLGGRRVSSALFHPSTKPIFRSLSARYVLFIQMSKEMWDFDAEGSGEIMFDKVVNGFLPELFKRWERMQVRHLVSVVLFTRIEYDAKRSVRPPGASLDHTGGEDPPADTSKDHYRVVVSDMDSADAAGILDRLKHDFRIFLRDTTTRKPGLADHDPFGSGISVASMPLPAQIISGQPSTAARGNVLEAVNLATSQFSSDYIDRDLARTGVSVVVVSPGTGLFEVDYNLLVATTDNLTDHGVRIDLVCLSGMPLHSVPLFKYRRPFRKDKREDPGADSTPTQTFANTMSYGTPSGSSSLSSPSPGRVDYASLSRWGFAVPHWVDISYWTSVDTERNIPDPAAAVKGKGGTGSEPSQHRQFKPRIRMHELQMMGVTEDAAGGISIPMLPRSSRPATTSVGKPAFHKDFRRAGVLRQNPAAAPPSSWIGEAQVQTTHPNPLGRAQDPLGWMDDYDRRLFTLPAVGGSHSRKGGRRSQTNKLGAPRRKRTWSADSPASSLAYVAAPGPKESTLGPTAAGYPERKVSHISSDRKSHGRPGAVARKISFGPRGLGVGAAKAATALAETSTVSYAALGTKMQERPAPSGRQDLATIDEQIGQEGAADGARESTESSQEESTSSDDASRGGSRPIPIRKSTAVRFTKEGRDSHARQDDRAETLDRVAALKDLRDRNGTELPDQSERAQGPDLPTLSPGTSMAPWLTVLNPCNPSRKLLSSPGRLGRWQHLYPRPPKASRIKWKSLCSPAAVPLTTEEFPSADQLADEYRRRSYLVNLPEKFDIAGRNHSLANELLAFRLARGFQIVVGDLVADATADASVRSPDVWSGEALARPGSSVLLSRGGTIHRLTRVAADRMEVKLHLRHTTAHVGGDIDDAHVHYTPLIRSVLATGYEHQAIPIAPSRGAFNWDAIDAFIASREESEAAQYVGDLRPWRARFVLVPADGPAASRERDDPDGDTREEVRLEGIQKLTQLWRQSSRTLPERHLLQRSARSTEDMDPLEVKYFTADPSVVVRGELANAVGRDASSDPAPAPPEPDLYRILTLDLKSVAGRLQSARGVSIMDRRWHSKMHWHCFTGSDLTTWLLRNILDVSNRQEAVELGNVLMRGGLFEHVERRHVFRDGHYFYRMANGYRAEPNSASFAIPTGEAHPSTAKQMNRLRASSRSDSRSDTDTLKSTEKRQRPGVALGRSIIYNLDDGDKGYSREETVRLHYDTLLNPDNCYHIRLEWMNATAKLVQDAVVEWARSAETYGWHLVEVPIDEASSTASMYPFRAPHTIELAREPPVEQPARSSDAESSAAQTNLTEKHSYQKAILEKFDFVLDFEAATDFPPEVEVSYSWGAPDYRYSQYIHRSGLLLAQITDKGHFLLLANRLFNDRSLTARVRKAQSQADASTHVPRQRPSTRPLPSGIAPTRAALDALTPTTTNRGPPPDKSPQSQRAPQNSTADPTPTVSLEKLTRDFEDFCNSKEALDAFYAAQLNNATASDPSMPVTSGERTPLRGPETMSEESSIPELALSGKIADHVGASNAGEGSETRTADGALESIDP